MSEEPRLPEDLMALEARLAAQSLPAVSLERGEVLFRAGWAAADAAAGRTRRNQLVGRIAWPVCSAAAAALLAVMATLQWVEERGPVASAGGVVHQQEVAQRHSELDIDEPSSTPAPDAEDRSDPRGMADMLTLRNQLLTETDWVTRRSERPTATGVTRWRTERELLREFLPEKAGTSRNM